MMMGCAVLQRQLGTTRLAAGHGVIVNMGSVNGEVGMAVAALYGATKSAIHSLTASRAAELAPQGIRVNAVAPGPACPAKAYADDPAAAVFLSGDEAAHIHGAILPVDGGYLAVR